jgi:hypothetical protein
LPPSGVAAPRDRRPPEAVIDLEGCSPLQPREQNIVPIGCGGAEGPAPSRGPYRSGGLQSLPAAGAAHCPHRVRRRRGTGALQGPYRSGGCSPFQPQEMNIVPIGCGGAEGPAPSQGPYRSGGLQSLAAVGAETLTPSGFCGAEGPDALQGPLSVWRAAVPCRRRSSTLPPSGAAAPRDRTPSRGPYRSGGLISFPELFMTERSAPQQIGGATL